MTKCHHKNLVKFTGAVLEEPVIIVMELMQCTLRSALTKGNILPQHVQSVFLDVAEGLCYLHNIKPQPIIHGDVSPTNVLVKIMDGLQSYQISVALNLLILFRHLIQVPQCTELLR